MGLAFAEANGAGFPARVLGARRSCPSGLEEGLGPKSGSTVPMQPSNVATVSDGSCGHWGGKRLGEDSPLRIFGVSIVAAYQIR